VDANDFLLSAVLETRDWKEEPMVLVSFGELKEQLGLEKTQRRFSFTQLSGSVELPRIASEARERKRVERPLNRLQQEALSVSDRLALFARVMDGSVLLIVPTPKKETDPWVPPEPLAMASYYNESQSEAVGSPLQEMIAAYQEADSFKFSRSANQLREKVAGRYRHRFIPPNRNCGWNISITISKAFTAPFGFTESRSLPC
jgi:hypothetical protein